MEISTKVQKQGRDVPRPLSLCMGFMKKIRKNYY